MAATERRRVFLSYLILVGRAGSSVQVWTDAPSYLGCLLLVQRVRFLFAPPMLSVAGPVTSLAWHTQVVRLAFHCHPFTTRCSDASAVRWGPRLRCVGDLVCGALRSMKLATQIRSPHCSYPPPPLVSRRIEWASVSESFSLTSNVPPVCWRRRHRRRRDSNML